MSESPEIGQVVGLGAAAHAGGLELDEVADMDLVGDVRARPDAGERADDDVAADAGALDVAEGLDLRSRRHAYTEAEAHVGADRDVGRELRVGGEPHRVGIGHADARLEGGQPQALLQGLLRHRELGARIDALELRLVAFDGDRGVARGAGRGHRVGEIELVLDVVVLDRAQQRADQRAVEAHDAGIAEVDRLLGLVGIAALDDPLQHAVAHDQPAIGRADPWRRSPARRRQPWPCGRPRPGAAAWRS